MGSAALLVDAPDEPDVAGHPHQLVPQRQPLPRAQPLHPRDGILHMVLDALRLRAQRLPRPIVGGGPLRTTWAIKAGTGTVVGRCRYIQDRRPHGVVGFPSVGHLSLPYDWVSYKRVHSFS